MTVINMDEDNLESRIYGQIKYYFSDYNLTHDTFMQKTMKEHSDAMPIDILMKFNKLKNICNDGQKVIEAIKKHNALLEKPFLLINNDKLISRNVAEYPLPANFNDYIEKLKSHSIYIKGFPKTSTLEEITTFLTEHGPVLNVFMRYYTLNNNSANSNKNKPKIFTADDHDGNDKCADESTKEKTNNSTKGFKGSIFVTFEHDADAQKLLSNPLLKYANGTVILTKMYKHDYETQKQHEFEERQQKRQKRGKKAGNVINGEIATDNKSGSNVEPKGEEAASLDDRVKEIMQRGNIVKIVGFDTSDGRMNRHVLKETFDNYATVSWVDYDPGNVEAYIRLTGGENLAAPILSKLTGAANCEPEQKKSGDEEKNETENEQKKSDEENETKDDTSETLPKQWQLSIQGQNGLKATVLSGAEEFQFWRDIVSKVLSAASNKSNFDRKRGNNKRNQKKGGGGFKNRRNDRNNNNKRKANNENQESNTKEPKVAKIEAV